MQNGIWHGPGANASCRVTALKRDICWNRLDLERPLGTMQLHERISGTAADIQHEMDDAIADRSPDV